MTMRACPVERGLKVNLDRLFNTDRGAERTATAILRTLGSLLGPTRVAAGCIQARLCRDLDKRKTLLLAEEWESREQFERNLDTVKANTIVAAIELSSKPPIVRVELG